MDSCKCLVTDLCMCNSRTKDVKYFTNFTICYNIVQYLQCFKILYDVYNVLKYCSIFTMFYNIL